jgi:hypothetical protein
MPVSPVTERLGFTDLVSRLSGEAPRRDRERLLFTDLRPELRASKIGAIRLPRSDGSRLRLTEYFQFILDLAIAHSNLAHSLRNHYVAVENAILDPTPNSPRLLALAAEGLLSQVASGSTLSTERALDRHWRNLKVLASHNPSIYKHQILGAYELHGTQPPLSVYF